MMQINMVTLRILATKVSLRLASRQGLEYATVQVTERRSAGGAVF
tara:strand:+ start:433 stop:567 length:135 start_codon:yes stop_codon:yes gene_type:complete